MLGRCNHGFHSECFKSWLKEHGTCPYVSFTLLSIRVADPLSQRLSPRPCRRLMTGDHHFFIAIRLPAFCVSQYAYLFLASPCSRCVNGRILYSPKLASEGLEAICAS